MINSISSNRTTLLSTISNENEKNIKNEKVEKSKVSLIKEAIQNNTYKIDINKTALSMASRLL
ncbi:MAG: flagellar biosynthesis anti-sigma factor FlgM [Nautilia sp.]|nr:MAG: flagellar biosynthesis anti-sigma factor FlgM [Nautilia sp.]